MGRRKVNPTSYRDRRIDSAIRGGFRRIKTEGTERQKAALRKGLLRVWESSIGKPCPMLCGRVLTPRTSAFCHNIALSQGGKHTASNIYLACKRDNNAQKSLPLAEYLELQTLIIKAFGEAKWVKIRSWLAGSRF